MARHCRGCGMPLDETGHDIEPLPEKVRILPGPDTYMLPRTRVYGCRVRLVATNPGTGKTFAPHSPQRGSQIGQGHPPGAPDTHYARKDLL